MTLQKIHYISIEQQLFEKNISTSGLSTLFLAEPHLRQHLDAIHRPARHLLDTGVHPRDVQQQERHRHEALHAVVLLVGEPVANVRKV